MFKFTRQAVLTVCALCFSTLLWSQSLDHVQGEILVKIKTEANIRNVVRSIDQLNATPTKLTHKKTLSQSMGLYQLTFDHTSINENDMIAAIWRAEEVEIAQFNHMVKGRNTPNDPQFEDQWQYINTGQSGGVAGADIDADLAWDITTGGVTTQGDTIVVAALDDGIDTDHPDFEDNLWKNYAEIPNNNIDDDGNGYVDDYAGWNSEQDNDNIEGGGHGTPVAGIMGAKGNNGIGVAGMSWDVKVMVIKNNFNTNEAQVLAAYSYPLTMRQRYNATDGTEGAFVVSTNASWGVDGGDPANAPLWCAFYDTLGVHGIVSCGATINGNQNVDEFGDLPTACPSDYLISVTNMDDTDNKVTQAGYGAETIDLGAFGAGTWTTALGGGYAGFGGTSGATPHVAGAIGLLYSAPCSNFVALAKADPGAAALQAKAYILEGVDPNASLDGITTTGGRLNMNNTLMNLMGECGPCPAPAALSATSVTTDVAVLGWMSTDSTLSSTLSWREVGATDWVVVENATNPYTINNLLACTDYEFQVQDACANENSEASATYTFTTDGCCNAPEGLTVNYDGNEAVVTWEGLTAASAFNLMSSSNLSMDVVSDLTATTYTITDLGECETYFVSVQTVCADGTITEFSDAVSFTTVGCGQCIDGDYCEITASTEYEYIDVFELGSINNASGDNMGYANFTEFTTDLTQGQMYDATITPGFNQGSANELIKIWIDYNQNDEFEDGELVYESEAVTVTTTGSFMVPFDALEGNTRMRVRMNYAPEGPIPPCASEFEGEVEDYCVNILEGSITCDEVPMNLDTMQTTETTAQLIWDATTNAQTYTVRYKKLVDTDWTETFGLINTSVVLSDFDDCTEYEAQVRAVCDDELASEYSPSFNFQTRCINSTIELPTELTQINVYPNPFISDVQLDMNVLNATDVDIEVVDINGKVLHKEATYLNSGHAKITLSLDAALPQGLYFVQIRTATGIINKRMMKY